MGGGGVVGGLGSYLLGRDRVGRGSEAQILITNMNIISLSFD